MTHTHQWWQTAVIYHIYPRSFYDRTGDGVGDLPGITNKLDYLAWLGVDAMWISPIYPSPMADFGYDVSNYTDVHPLFGTLDDLDHLLQQAHQRGLKVLLDFVPNHTSDEHPWFQQSRASRTNAQRDWYIWRDPAPDGGPPNNWTSFSGGSAWEFDEPTRQYYLHKFHVKQPDVNWRNPDLRQAMYDVLRFWLDRGVDGFRIDVLSSLLKDAQLRDNPPNPTWVPGDHPSGRLLRVYTGDLPEVHAIVREMRALADAYDERVLIGELSLPTERLMRYYGAQLDEVHLPTNFQLLTLPAWDARVVQQVIDAYEAALPPGAWPNWVLSNHDQPRIATRVGRAQARVAQMLLLTLRGTPTCYYGDEVGMENGPIPQEWIQDPLGKDNPAHSRDPERTPMHWNADPNAGFCPAEATPWLPVAPDYPTYNVAVEQDDPRSFLVFMRTLLAARRAHPALSHGSYHAVEQAHASCCVYQRQDQDRRYIVILNFSPHDQMITLPEYGQGQVLVSTHVDRAGGISFTAVQLRGNEGLLVSCDQ